MENNSFTYRFTTSKIPEEVFQLLLDIPQWWSGLFGETIAGKSERPGDEFTFAAGGGLHYSKQKLAELIPGKRIAWEVTDSKLGFIKDTGEWNHSRISFNITPENDGTRIVFTHEGLTPRLECYDNCSAAWTQYLTYLQQKLYEPVSV